MTRHFLALQIKLGPPLSACIIRRLLNTLFRFHLMIAMPLCCGRLRTPMRYRLIKRELVLQVIAPAEIWHRQLHSKRVIMELSWHSSSLSIPAMIATLTLPPIKNMPPALGSQHRLWNGSGINIYKVMPMIKTHMQFRKEQKIFRH